MKNFKSNKKIEPYIYKYIYIDIIRKLKFHFCFVHLHLDLDLGECGGEGVGGVIIGDLVSTDVPALVLDCVGGSVVCQVFVLF